MAISWQQWIHGHDPATGNQPAAGWPFGTSAQFLEQALGAAWLSAPFSPTDADQKAASDFYIQLLSRITTRRLHYLDGDEQTALTSVFRLFGFARDICGKHEPDCRRFTQLVWTLLNEVVRPFTAKWHKRFEDQDGKLSEDQRHEFREELIPLQDQLAYHLQLFEALSQADAIKAPPVQTLPTPPQHQELEFTRLLFSPNVDDSTAAAIQLAERDEINRRRGQQDSQQNPNDITGLALSGGGLRSATFALGALQGLANNRMLPNFDYLSTVSGGGYAGSFLSCFLNTNVSTTPPVGLGPHELPFARFAAQESAPMRHLRASSKVLITGGFWKKIQIPVLALAGWLGSLFVVLPPIVAFTLLFCLTNSGAIQRAIQSTEPQLVVADEVQVERASDIYASGCWQFQLVGIVGIVVLVGLAILLWLQQYRRKNGLTDLPATAITCVAFALFFFVGLLAWLLFPIAMTTGHQIKNLVGNFPLPSEGVMAGLAAVSVPIFSRLASQTGKSSKLKKIISGLGLTLSPLLFIGLIAILIARHWLFVGDDYSLHRGYVIILLFVTLLILVVSHWLLNINACSLHPFYRDRLARAYHLQMDGSGHVKASTPQKLTELRQYNSTGPYHLINAALNAPAGKSDALRGRTADFFVFSSNYCGSETTGYQPTTDFQDADPSVDLATAIAISGAAASPFMGTNSSRFNFWFALFNVRLDYWLPIPGRRKRLRDGNPGPYYWLKQYTGYLTDTTPYVNLSDGGHIENMAIYELLRRRCRYIVCIDGECDPGITCGSLLQLVRYAKIDFGIEIEIDLSRLKHADVRSQTASGASADPLPTGKDASPEVDFHFALGRIHYPKTAQDPVDPPPGLLLYIKSSMSGNEAKQIRSYRERHPEFPHESTGDLAYDEEQFEVYRALGEHIVDDAFREELVGATPPANIRQWLQALSVHLFR